MLNASQNTKFSPWNTVQKRPGLTNSFLFDLKDDKRLAVTEPWFLNHLGVYSQPLAALIISIK